MNVLVGHTGFVGSNLYLAGMFDLGVNSKSVEEAYGTHPELLVYAGLRAEKYIANQSPERDMVLIREAEDNIRRIGPERLVLISTVDVFREPCGKDEGSCVDTEGLAPYGLNRYRLEEWVRKEYPNALIIRLPGLFGKNLKKNFLYDYLYRIPFRLNEGKMEELSAQEPELKQFYQKQENGFWQCDTLDAGREAHLKELFGRVGFDALSFTDSRNVYQFYPLSRLWKDMQTALDAGIELFHPATEPVSAGEVYHALTGKEWVNQIIAQPVRYDYRTRYAGLFGKEGGYIMEKAQVMEAIRAFVEEEKGTGR